MRRGILGAVGGRITDVERVRCALKPLLIQPSPAAFRRRVVGRRVQAVERIGKRVVLRLDSGEAIVFEPRMTGLVLISDPPDPTHLRFRLRFSGCRLREVLYWDRRGLGSVRLLTAAQLQEQLGSEKLGPDALVVTAAQLRELVGTTRRPIKVALLDQRLVTGIGNLYAAEILHVAGVSPLTGADQLSAGIWRRLHAALQQVLVEAIRYEGSTLSDGTYRNALNEAGGYQNHHRVYDREGERCPTCRTGTVKRIVQAQRATFFCPACQRGPRRRGPG